MSVSLPRPGDLFAGRYRIDGQLAAGGMGAVFSARDEKRGRAVAIKFLHPELADDQEMHRRFKREGSILQSLDHPSVVRVYDVGRDEQGRSYTVMEKLEGETLHACIERRGALDPGELAPIVEGVCGGLAAAHAHGVLHADLKPANVFLVSQANAVRATLVDFGTSKVHGLDRLTRTGEVIGTPIYMAPELLTGDGAISAQIDVYALGVLMYQALSGAVPFEERNPGKLLYQIVLGQAVPLEQRVPGLGPAVVEVVRRAMAPKKPDRFESAVEVGAAYAAALG